MSEQLTRGETASMVARTKAPARPSVLSLFLGRCPSAVVGRIAALVVYPVDRQSMGPLTHVGKKVLKFVPSVANRNSATAVIFVSIAILVVTTFEHFGPRQKRAAYSALDRMAVYEFATAGILTVEATAGLRVATSEVPDPDTQYGTAIATNLPMDNSAFAGDAIEGDQTTVAVSCDINDVGHCDLSYRLRAKWWPDFGGSGHCALKV